MCAWSGSPRLVPEALRFQPLRLKKSLQDLAGFPDGKKERTLPPSSRPFSSWSIRDGMCMWGISVETCVLLCPTYGRLTICSFMHSSSYLFIHQSPIHYPSYIHPSLIHLSPTIHLSIHASTIHPSIHYPFTHPCIHAYIIYPSIIHPSILTFIQQILTEHQQCWRWGNNCGEVRHEGREEQVINRNT